MKQLPADGVMPYEVNAVLYADEAVKYRFIKVPKGEHATYDPTGQWKWPDGTILVKTFAYLKDYRDPSKGQRLLETRLIIKQGGKWTGNTYVWNDAQTQAVHEIAGDLLPATWIDADGKTQKLDYRVPDNNDCTKCHSTDHVFHPLGPRTRELNRDNDYGSGPVNQIDHMVKLGTLKGDIPPVDQRETLAPPYDTSLPLNDRARGYLDANCAHCHSPGGAAESSGLDLRLETPFGGQTGECKTPNSAGRGTGGFQFTLVPGDPDHSVIVFRMRLHRPRGEDARDAHPDRGHPGRGADQGVDRGDAAGGLQHHRAVTPGAGRPCTRRQGADRGRPCDG